MCMLSDIPHEHAVHLNADERYTDLETKDPPQSLEEKTVVGQMRECQRSTCLHQNCIGNDWWAVVMLAHPVWKVTDLG